jgi:hypothetical protein
MRLSVPFIALLASLALAAPALAQEDKVYAPPGNSGIGEYLEVVPGAGGDKPASGGGGGTGSAPSQPAEALGSANAKSLEALGADGKAAATAAAAGSPTTAKAARDRARKRSANESKLTESSSIATQTSGNEVTSVARALSGEGGGVGIVLPAFLVLSLVVALGVGARRLLRRS